MAHAATADSEFFRERERERIRDEMEAMSDAMVREEGLLNHAQAALILDVSARRVAELVELGKLQRFDFLGRTYVSVKEIRVRREADVKAGRPARGVLKRVVVGLKAAAKTDLLQAKQGGFAGPFETAKAKAKRKK